MMPARWKQRRLLAAPEAVRNRSHLVKRSPIPYLVYRSASQHQKFQAPLQDQACSVVLQALCLERKARQGLRRVRVSSVLLSEACSGERALVTLPEGCLEEESPEPRQVDRLDPSPTACSVEPPLRACSALLEPQQAHSLVLARGQACSAGPPPRDPACSAGPPPPQDPACLDGCLERPARPVLVRMASPLPLPLLPPLSLDPSRLRRTMLSRRRSHQSQAGMHRSHWT
mmetsp:Transcript_64991/g.163767  ORF Transcript_64991/g.163767 Transcript_64991/m.163767 type:complete len:229 (+) Transcript_64991:2444-3130(+)